MKAVARLAAVFVGLVNLIVLAYPNGVVTAYQKGGVGWYEALPPALLAAVGAELVASRIAPRCIKFAALEGGILAPASRCSRLCLGGRLVGFLPTVALTVNSCWFPGRLTSYSGGY